MRKRLVLPVLLMAVFGCEDAPVLPTGPDLSAGPPAAQDRYIVVFADNAGRASSVAASIAREHGLAPDFVYQHALQGFAAAIPDNAVRALERDPRVKYVVADGVAWAIGEQSPVPSWGLDRIDMRLLPLDATYTYPSTGAGVTFYGIDTGIRATHADFGGRVSGGFTSILDGNGTDDCHGHGTHTASTAAGVTYGVAKAMTVVPVRVLDCGGSGLYSQIIAGVDWVTANAALPAVANMSLGGLFNQALNDAVEASVQSGVFYSVAAGNNNFIACIFSPASAPSAFTVGATGSDDSRASFSNTGGCLDIFAPGVGITAAWSTSDNATATISGTSMAAPHAAGAAGLYLEGSPTATPAEVSQALVENGTAGVVGNAGTDSPNLLLYMGFIAQVNQPPVAHFTAHCDNSTGQITCTADGSTSTDDHGVASYRWVGSRGNVVGTGPTVSATLSGPWTGPLTLTVTDAAGLSDTFVGLVDGTPPVAHYTFACDANRYCTADGSVYSSDDQGIVSYLWSAWGFPLGTGPTLSGTPQPGFSFPLTLTVWDASGLTGSRTHQITVP